MKISRFANNPDSTPLHASGIAGDTAPKPQPFSKRQQLERHRQIIQTYQKSLIGSQTIQRGKINSKRRTARTSGSEVPTRQELNAKLSARVFKEPAIRKHNPYS